MAFKTAAAPVATAQGDDEYPEVPASIPRHGGNGNPKIRSAEATARFSYYTRASKFGEVIENAYLLHRRELRAVAYGMSRRDDLVLAGAAVPAFEDREDAILHKAYREELQRIATEAMSEAPLDRAATRGTAFHKLSERKDAGDDLSFLGPVAWAALEQWRRIMAGFEIIGTEQFVVNDALGAGGTYDRLLSPLAPLPVIIPVDGVMTQVALIEPGETIVADLKSGRTADYFGPTYSVQQWTYASGRPYEHVSDAAAADGDNGRRDWPDGRAPRQDWALIPHVPIDSPEDAGLMWVNLDRGRQLAELALANREARKLDDLFYEAAVPLAPAPVAAPRDERAELREVLVDLIESAVDEAAINGLYDGNQDVWTDELTAAVVARLGVLRVSA